MYLKTPDAPGQRVFSRCAAPFFREIRQYSCVFQTFICAKISRRSLLSIESSVTCRGACFLFEPVLFFLLQKEKNGFNLPRKERGPVPTAVLNLTLKISDLSCPLRQSLPLERALRSARAFRRRHVTKLEGSQLTAIIKIACGAASEEASSIPLPPGRRKLHIRWLLPPFQTVTAALGHSLGIRGALPV